MNLCFAFYKIFKPKKVGFTRLNCNDSGVVLGIQFIFTLGSQLENSGWEELLRLFLVLVTFYSGTLNFVIRMDTVAGAL